MRSSFCFISPIQQLIVPILFISPWILLLFILCVNMPNSDTRRLFCSA